MIYTSYCHMIEISITYVLYKVGRFHPFTGHEGPQGEQRYSSTLFQMTSALEGGKRSASRPGSTLPPGKTWYPLYRRLGGPQGWSGLVRKISPHWDLIPRPSSLQAVAISTTLPGPQVMVYNPWNWLWDQAVQRNEVFPCYGIHYRCHLQGERIWRVIWEPVYDSGSRQAVKQRGVAVLSSGGHSPSRCQLYLQIYVSLYCGS